MSKVKIIPKQDGGYITMLSNGLSSITVQEQRNIFKSDGSLDKITLEADIQGNYQYIQELLDEAAEDDYILSGKIRIRESLAPFNIAAPEKHLKLDSKTGLVLKYNNKPIYRLSYYAENSNIPDELIAHTNQKEIDEIDK